MSWLQAMTRSSAGGRRAVLGVLAAAVTLVASGSATTGATRRAGIPSLPITHVVVIVEEDF